MRKEESMDLSVVTIPFLATRNFRAAVSLKRKKRGKERKKKRGKRGK